MCCSCYFFARASCAYTVAEVARRRPWPRAVTRGGAWQLPVATPAACGRARPRLPPARPPAAHSHTGPRPATLDRGLAAARWPRPRPRSASQARALASLAIGRVLVARAALGLALAVHEEFGLVLPLLVAKVDIVRGLVDMRQYYAH
jgi:hypothetical protein